MKEGPEYWEEALWDSRFFQIEFRRHLRVAMRCFNHTEGFHSAQGMFGCELSDDGSTTGYCHFAYDGKEVIYLDKERGIYIPTVYEAQLTTQEWNSPEMRWGELTKGDLENECIEEVKNFINYGREALERQVPPEVKVWGHRQSDGVTRLQCLVYGFHPRPVDVKWVRNGKDDVPSDEMSPILPHPDGTYQIRVSVEVPTREGDTYSCHVDHSSLGTEALTLIWEPNSDLPLGVTVGAIFGCLIAVAAVAVGGFYLYKKKKYSCRRTNTFDTDPLTELSNIPKA
ncbi:class I histocompatibility antigen, Gogo-B*0101 alpha chain-like isoform X4 [Lithobates pipiens]